MIPALVVAGVATGVGKTTRTLGRLEAPRRRGVTVPPFKVGPASGPPRMAGYVIGTTLMSEVHRHFGSSPAVSGHLVRHVRARRHGHAGEPVAVAPPEEGLRT